MIVCLLMKIIIISVCLAVMKCMICALKILNWSTHKCKFIKIYNKCVFIIASHSILSDLQ